MKKIIYAFVFAALAAGAILAFSSNFTGAAVQYNGQKAGANIAQQNASGISQQPVPPSKPPAQPTAQASSAQPGAQAGDVVITAQRMPEAAALVAGDIDIIKADDIKHSGLQSVSDILEAINGIYIAQNGGYEGLSQIFTRGAPADETLVMIDSVPVNDIMSGAADLTALDASMAQCIEVLKGGLSSIYGACASAGAINILTGSKDPKPLSAAADYGSFNYQKYTLYSDYKIMGITYAASAVEERSDGYAPNSDFMKRSADLKLQFKGDLLDSTLTGYYFKRTMGVPYGPLGPDLFSRQTDENYNLGIDEKLNIGPLKAKFSGYMRSEDLSYQDPSYGLYTSDVKKEYESNAMFSYDGGGNIAVTTGYETDLKDVNAPEIAGEKSVSNQASITSVTAKFLGDTLLLNGGFRADFNSVYGNMTGEDISLKYKMPDNVELRGMFDKSFSPPAFNDLYRLEAGPPGQYYYYIAGNPDLKTENSTDYSVSISKKDTNIKESLTFFSNSIDNLIAWESTPDLVTTTPVNISKADILGAEAKVEISVGDNLAIRGGYTYLNATDALTKEPLAYRPVNDANINADISLPFKTKINICARYVDIRYSTNGAELKPYYLLNGSISQEMSKNITLHFNVDNILNNRTYQVVQNYVMPGINMNGGITVEF
jgi:vitamin B12 transporter